MKKDILKEKYKIELENSNKQAKRFGKYKVPDFDIGLNYLGLKITDNQKLEKVIDKYVKEWFKNPLKNFKLYKRSEVRENNGFLEFPSISDRSQIVRFKYNPQPKNSCGNKVAVIHLMHWNGRFMPYNTIINFIRRTGIPVATLIHIPAGRWLDPGHDDNPDFEAISPNIGKTIFETIQNVIDIQFMARYLKEKMGYEKVGLFAYSIGSMRGALASMANPKLFDFGIFHLLADNFTEAVMKGVATRDIARKINGNIDYVLLKNFWSVISLGAYSKFFKKLPRNTRLVQCKYDFVFGPENVKRINTKILKERPDIELQIAPLTHTTIGKLPLGLKIMQDNIRFIYKHTKMKKCWRYKFFK